MIGTPHLIDIQALVHPIPGSLREEAATPFSLRDELDRARRGPDAAPFGTGSKSTSLGADWQKVVRLSRDWIAGRAKDFAVAARMAEALVKLHGAAGLRDGLVLLRRLVEECWDDLTPQVEQIDDLEARLAPLHWLEDPDRGALFPGTVRLIPLVIDASRSYSWVAWRKIQAKDGDLEWKEFERAIRATPYAACSAAVEDLATAAAELERLTSAVAARSGQGDFRMPELARSIHDCQELAGMILDHHPDHGRAAETGLTAFRPIEEEEEDADVEVDEPTYLHHPPAYNREQIYELIDQLAEMLQAIEPHSPVPYLLRRAVDLGALPFPQLMKELIRDQGVLGRVCIELGIREGV